MSTERPEPITGNQRMDAALACRKVGCSVKQSAVGAGVSHHTIADWLSKGRADLEGGVTTSEWACFVTAWDAARLQCVIVTAEHLAASQSDSTRVRMLEALTREDGFGEHRTVDLSLNVQVTDADRDWFKRTVEELARGADDGSDHTTH